MSTHKLAASLAAMLMLTGTAPGFAEESREQWMADGQAHIAEALAMKPAPGRAKNVILFVGDGMGVSTVTAARILEGQLRGEMGEENVLSFERLPYLALSKVYNTNQTTPDSAGTMTSMMTGVKTKAGVLGVDQDTARGDHTTVHRDRLQTILETVEHMGKSTGVVSTARITHATPAACYAKSPDRNWEDDSSVPEAAAAAGFKDIARQLVEFPVGNGLEVAMGGGRRNFLPSTMDDPEGGSGRRTDGRNLAAEWEGRGGSWRYVWNEAQFNAIDAASTDHLLGLFEQSHMEYEHDRPGDEGGEPSLSAMTEKAIQVLSKNPKGYFLHVESGRIDHAHHEGNAWRALTDTHEFAKAVQTAMDMTDMNETLIIVTADHSHVFTIAGYPTRGNPILGLVRENDSTGLPKTEPNLDDLGLPYTTLGYGNGPGFRPAGRPTLTADEVEGAEFLQEATVGLGSETHSAEEVAIYAGGPGAHLFRGTVEQNVIYHVMRWAFGIN